MNSRKKYFIIAGIIAIVILGFVFYENIISGRVVLDIDAEYNENGVLNGVLRLSLGENEFIPTSSKIVFEGQGGREEFALGDLISEQAVEGVYYVEGTNISGEGMGHGFEEVKEVYPEVSFKLRIFSKGESDSSDTGSSGGGNIVEEVEVVENGSTDEEVALENESENVEVVENGSTDEEVVLGNESEIEAVAEEESAIVSEEDSVVEDEEEVVEEESAVEEVVEKEGVVEEEEIEEEAQVVKEATLEEEVSVITGNVLLELEDTISGSVFVGSPFSYELSEGESVELVAGSVVIDSEVVDDDYVNFEISDGTVLVSTDYFYESDLSSEARVLEINLSAIGLNFSAGELNISLVYDGVEIVSLSTVLEESAEIEVESEESVLNISDEDVLVLVRRFGNVSVETTKSEVIDGRLIRNCKVGDYERVASYDYDGNVTDSLREQMERDRINFLMDLVRMISEESIETKYIEEFLGSSSF